MRKVFEKNILKLTEDEIGCVVGGDLGGSAVVMSFFMLYRHEDLNCYKAQGYSNKAKGLAKDVYVFAVGSVGLSIVFNVALQLITHMS